MLPILTSCSRLDRRSQDARPEAKKKGIECSNKAWGGVKGIGEFNASRLASEEEYRELACAVEDKGQFPQIMKTLYECLAPGEDGRRKYMKEIHQCMSELARKEEKGEAR